MVISGMTSDVGMVEIIEKRLTIVRKIVDHYQKFLKSRINSQNRKRKSKSKSKIDNRKKISVSQSFDFFCQKVGNDFTIMSFLDHGQL